MNEDPIRYNARNVDKLLEQMEDEVQILMELDDSNFEFIVEESQQGKLLVFRVLNTLGDESTALANITIMFRGEPQKMVDILSVFLAVKESTGEMNRIGQGMPDDDDPRVLRVSDWTPSVPLPLGSNLLNRLRIVVHVDEHVEPSRVKFAADLVPFPEVFLEGNPRMKRRLGTSTIRFRGGNLLEIENAVSALQLVVPSKPVISCEPSGTEQPIKVSLPSTMKPPTFNAIPLTTLLANLQKMPAASSSKKSFWWDEDFVKSSAAIFATKSAGGGLDEEWFRKVQKQVQN